MEVLIFHQTTPLKEKAKAITDRAYKEIVLKFKDTLPAVEQQVSDLTLSIRNDTDMAILHCIKKRQRQEETEKQSNPPQPSQKRPKNLSTPPPPNKGGY